MDEDDPFAGISCIDLVEESSRKRPRPPYNMSKKWWTIDDCLAAIRGQRVPEKGLGDVETRQCVVRGIRYHDNFGEELRGVLPIFTRALNARMIMSNVIPDIEADEEFPYCIWYPDIATEHTYRTLANRYTQMKYQVGRACAVAGYFQLYTELNILPEVHIAEEARENKATGHAIYDLIMASPCRYEVMNDYTRTINEKQATPLAQLNGDTAVRALLDFKQLPRRYHHSPIRYFDITEDMGMDEFDSNELVRSWAVAPLLYDTLELDFSRTALLYNPLPFDLPTIQKDLLILMAAYSGNVDRYARLRRPVMIPKERESVVHGIYHNTMFAKWWSLQPEIENSKHFSYSRIREAIEARFIMNNDISRSVSGRSELPYLIYYPKVACSTTYALLAIREPRMLHQIARACIVANYQGLFDQLDPPPDDFLLVEARASFNPHYKEFLEQKAKDYPAEVRDFSTGPGWQRYNVHDLSSRSMTTLRRHPDTRDVSIEFDFLYNGRRCDVSGVEGVCFPDEMMPEDVSEVVSVADIYIEQLDKEEASPNV